MGSKFKYGEYVRYQGKVWRAEGMTDHRGLECLVNVKDTSQGIGANPMFAWPVDDKTRTASVELWG